MKHKYIISVLGVVMPVCLVAGTVGCAADQGGGMDRERGVADMMMKTPENAAYLSFVDAKELRSDNDIEHLYEAWRDNLGRALDDCGIVADDVNLTAMGMSSEGVGYYLIDGSFNPREVGDKLGSLGFDEDEYRGVELWERNGESVALMEGLVILGTGQGVRDCIEVTNGEKDSLWDNQDVKDIVDRLPDGFSVKYICHPQHMAYEGMKAQATCLEKKDEDTLKMTGVFMFEDEDTARDAVTEIKEDTGAEEIERSDVKQDGKFVILTIEVGIDEMFMF